MTERKTEFLSMPEGGTGSGATAEQLAQIEQNAEDITALKGDLANKLPKSPAAWESWTAEEQAAARDNIGIHKVTQAEYDALTDTSGIYIIVEE